MKRSIAPVLLLVLAGCTSGRVPDSLTSTGATSTVAVAAAPTGGIAGSDMAVTVQPGLIEFAVPASRRKGHGAIDSRGPSRLP